MARHAAKHAEELRKRNAEPPPPGSARATLRVPPEAEAIKAEADKATAQQRIAQAKAEEYNGDSSSITVMGHSAGAMLGVPIAFAGEDLTEILASVVKVEPDFTNVPFQLRRLLAKCLQKDPKQRLRERLGKPKSR